MNSLLKRTNHIESYLYDGDYDYDFFLFKNINDINILYLFSLFKNESTFN